MRLPPDGFFIPRRGAYLKGLGIWRWQGDRLYFQRAPRRVPTPRSEAERFNRSQLYWSTQVVKIMDAYQRDFALYISKNSQLAAQDLMYISLFGRLGHLVRRDGTKVFSMAAMQDVSNLLDALYQLKGGVLVRDETWWKGLDPGSAGQVLTMLTGDEIGWETPAAPASSPALSQPSFTAATASTDAFATQGVIYSLQKAVTIHGIIAYMAPSSGQLYKLTLGLCSVSAGNYTLTSVSSGPATAPDLSRADTWTQLNPTTPFAAPAGSLLFVGVTRSNGTTTNPVPIGQGHGIQQNAPLPGGIMRCVNLASTAPAVSNTFTNRADIGRIQAILFNE